MPAPWQRVEVLPVSNTGVPMVSVMVTSWEATFGPLQPAASAVMVEVPVHPAR